MILDRVVAHSLPYVPKAVVRKVASRYIAGETLDEALDVAASLNRKGMCATLDVLGEHIHGIDQARRAVSQYLQVLEHIHSRKLDANVSIKLTQLGLKVDWAACLELTGRLVKLARQLNNFVRIDMEDSSCTSDTLRLYRELRKEYSNVGVVIQAYLRRTERDVADLHDLKPNFRLCDPVTYDAFATTFQISLK